MKITLSKKNDPRGKHLVLLVPRAEMEGIHKIIVDEIMPSGREPNRDVQWEHISYGGEKVHRRIKHIVYRFHRSYLERLVLTFPQVQMSPAADRFYRRMSRDEFNAVPVPKIKIPGFKGKLWKFQKVGTAKLVEIIRASDVFDVVRGGFLNDEMGLGKTVQALAAIAHENLWGVLIVTTNSGKWAWLDIQQRLFPNLDLAVVDGTKFEKAKTILEEHQITVVNVESIRGKISGRGQEAEFVAANPELFGYIWNLLIIDESHKLKNPKAQQTLGFLGLDAERVITMSGTPFLNRPDELWPVLHKIAPDEWPDYDEYISKLTIVVNGKVVAYRPKYVRKIKEFLETYGIRRRKDQVGIDMPDVVYSTVMVELTPTQRKLYKKIADEFLLLLEDGSIKSITAMIAQVTRLKQACFSPELYGGKPESAKISELKEIVETLAANGEKAIVFSQWKTATRIIERELAEYNPAYVDGTVKGSKRMAQQQKFNEDETCKVYVGTIGANQEAITLSAATYVIFCDKWWTPLANDQAAARSAAGGLRGVHLGAGAKVNIIDLYAHNTIEKAIDDLLKQKAQLFRNFIEGDGGAPVTKQLIDSIKSILIEQAAA